MDSLLGREGFIWIFVQGTYEFPVTPLLMWPFCLCSQHRFAEPVRAPPRFWLYKYVTIGCFDERFRDGQYSLVGFLFAVLLLTVPPVFSHL